MNLDLLDFWHWWVFGLLLIMLELFVPGAFFIWIGISAGVVGFLLLVIPSLSWETQFLVFAVLSVISVIAGRLYLNKNPIPTDRPTLNRRGEQYIGRTFTLSEPIRNGIGKIHVDDTMWKIRGDDCDAGTIIRVVEADGAVLKVESV